MNTVRNFIGNSSAKEAIVNWLNYHFHSTATAKCKKCGFPVMFKGDTEHVFCPKCNSNVNVDIKDYVFLYGNSGNGKSYLPELLANSFDVELFRITPLDIQSTNNLNEIIKSINMGTLSGKKHKIILIDDVDEYSSRYKIGLYEIGTISRHPVIYTSKRDLYPPYQTKYKSAKKYHTILEFIKNGLILRIYKPTTSEMFEHLKTISNLPDDTLKTIARESKSFRSAVLSTYTANVNDLIIPIHSKRELLKSVKDRKFKQTLRLDNWRNVDEITIMDIFKCIKGYGDSAVALSERLANFDYRMRVLFEEIDPCFVNDMIEPIETIDIDWVWKKKRKTVVKSKDQKTVVKSKDQKTVAPIVKKSTTPNIDKYL